VLLLVIPAPACRNGLPYRACEGMAVQAGKQESLKIKTFPVLRGIKA